MNTLAIDTNILIAALIKNSLIREIITNSNINLIFPEYGLEEVYSYKEEIKKKANLTEKELDILLLRILKHIRLIPLDIIINFKKESDEIMLNIHKEDSMFIALALAFDCPIWSDDKHFKKQKEIKIYNTKEILGVIT